MRSYRIGLIYGVVSCIIVLLLSLVPIENLILPRPPQYISYTPFSYLYTWRASTIMIILIILTLVLMYVHGSREFYVGILDVQVPAFIVIHYVYLYVMCSVYYYREGSITLLPLVYVYGNMVHIDLGQITAIYVIYRIVKILKSRFSRSSTTRSP